MVQWALKRWTVSFEHLGNKKRSFDDGSGIFQYFNRGTTCTIGAFQLSNAENAAERRGGGGGATTTRLQVPDDCLCCGTKQIFEW